MAHNQLTICAEMVYLDLPIEERIKRIDQMGFGVDIWTHYSHDLNKLKATGVPINSAQGYVHGNLAYADSPNLKLMLDLYHAQEDDGHLIETVKEANTYIGELQAADVPGRCEPGTGEVRWEQVAAAVNETDFTGPIGMEGYASGDSDKALQAFGQAFAQCKD